MAKFKIKKKDCLLTVTVKLNKNEIIDERQFGYFTQKNIRGTFKAALKSYIGYASRMKKQIQEISDIAQKETDKFLSSVDDADQYIF